MCGISFKQIRRVGGNTADGAGGADAGDGAVVAQEAEIMADL